MNVRPNLLQSRVPYIAAKLARPPPPATLYPGTHITVALTLLVRVAAMAIRGIESSVWDGFGQVWCIRASLSLLRVVFPTVIPETNVRNCDHVGKKQILPRVLLAIVAQLEWDTDTPRTYPSIWLVYSAAGNRPIGVQRLPLNEF